MGKEEVVPAAQGQCSRVTTAIHRTLEVAGGAWGSELGQPYPGLPFLVMDPHPFFLLLNFLSCSCDKILIQKQFKEERVYLTHISML